MGIQIYIATKAIQEAGLTIEFSSEVHNEHCCGDVYNGVCHNCDSSVGTYTERYARIEGFPILMGTFSNESHVYHDANHWGSSRKPILAFIEKYKIPHKDWYEA